jgi:hypothetical protein
MVSGTFNAGAAAANRGGVRALGSVATESIVVTVQEDSSITTTVGTDGSFTLRGLPTGSFTLVFTLEGDVIGEMEFDTVAPNQEIVIEVDVVDGEVVLVSEDRKGIGHPGLEIQGLVEQVVELDPTGDSQLRIAGNLVFARPGVTAIRKGNTRMTVSDVIVGLQVHVKGVPHEETPAASDVMAYEIKIQGTALDGETVTICHIPPGNPAKKKTITIGTGAWPAHEKHGDTLGPC